MLGDLCVFVCDSWSGVSERQVKWKWSWLRRRKSSKQDSSGIFQTGAPSAFTLGWYPKLNKDLPQHFYSPPPSLPVLIFSAPLASPQRSSLLVVCRGPFNTSSSIKSIWFIGWGGQMHDNIWKHYFFCFCFRVSGNKRHVFWGTLMDQE